MSPGRVVQSPPPGAASAPAAGPASFRETVRASERAALLAALDACAWNFARSAQQLGISRMTLYRRLQQCGISRTPGER
jgi:transcriptional regulator of acetoin/glycerol metabolism